MSVKRVHVWIKGKVQGVFFRNFCKKNADQLGLTGWVRNDDEGNLEAVFEGEEESLMKMTKLCEQGPPAAVIEKIEVQDMDDTVGYTDFEITR
jgi:acylphosphatase